MSKRIHATFCGSIFNSDWTKSRAVNTEGAADGYSDLPTTLKRVIKICNSQFVHLMDVNSEIDFSVMRLNVGQYVF